MYVRVERAGYTAWESSAYTASVAMKELDADMIADLPSVAYTGQAIEPMPEVKFGSIVLVKDTDYTVSYENNTDIGLATVVITGKGNYTGTTTVKFAIYKRSTAISNGEQVPQASAKDLDQLYDDEKAYTEEDRQIETIGGSVNIELPLP